MNESGGNEDGTGTISGRYGDVLPVFGLQIYSHAKGKGSDYSYVCPSIARYNFHAYSGGGRVNIGSGDVEERI